MIVLPPSVGAVKVHATCDLVVIVASSIHPVVGVVGLFDMTTDIKLLSSDKSAILRTFIFILSVFPTDVAGRSVIENALRVGMLSTEPA